MSDPNQPLVKTGPANNLPQIIYLLFFGGFIFAVLPVIGLVLAYVNKDKATPLELAHYEFQISTFWRGLLFVVVGAVTTFFLIGWLVLLFWAVWTVIRTAKGLSAYGRGEPMPADTGWGFG